MQKLAQGVGDLKKVFSNVKSRGYWGEVQLSAILEQFLTNEQYDKNVKTKPNTNDLVEFAIKLPGKNDNEFVWLPVDSKFPIEDYSRLVDAQDIGDVSLVNECRKKLENSVKSFAKDIFQQDLLCIYERQTEHRDKLRAEARDIVEDLVSKINSEIYISASIQHKLLELTDRLSRTKGKKVYGYLKPDVKAIVYSIVEELASDDRIKKLYDLWYEQKENTIRTYTDEIPERIPLAQNKEFKSIKNAIIKEALKLIPNEDEAEESENTDEEPVISPFEYEENTSAESVFNSDRGVLYPRYSIKANRNSVAVSSLYLLRYLCNIIQNQLRFEEKQKAQRTDKKLQQKINDKKQARGLKM